MVVVQFVDNGELGLVEGGKDENNYDKLLPPGEFEHLCTCTYGRVSPGVPPGADGGTGGRVEENHLAAITVYVDQHGHINMCTPTHACLYVHVSMTMQTHLCKH